MRRVSKLTAVTLLIMLCGCAAVKTAMKADFSDYNQIIQFNQTQQMLMNIVRLHYREPVTFLQTGALSASYESTTTANAGFEAAVDPKLTLGGTYQFTSKPTITYTPVDGESYARQFLSEVSIRTFGLLLRSGWPVGKLANLLIERIVPEKGAAILINKNSGPSQEAFNAFVKKLQTSQDRGDLEVRPIQKKPTNPDASESPEDMYDLRVGELSIPHEAIQFRSLQNIMFFLAKNTETPLEHQKRTKPGKPNNQMVIHVSNSRPDDAMVWTKYAGYFYSIDNNDTDSKDSFSLLMQLTRIQSTQKTLNPVLTLPVAR